MYKRQEETSLPRNKKLANLCSLAQILGRGGGISGSAVASGSGVDSQERIVVATASAAAALLNGAALREPLELGVRRLSNPWLSGPSLEKSRCGRELREIESLKGFENFSGREREEQTWLNSRI